MEWVPHDTVMITGGLKWSRYWSYDDFRDEKRREDQGWSSREKVRYKAVNYGLYMTDEQTDQYNAYLSRQSEIDAAQRRGTLTDEQRALHRSLMPGLNSSPVAIFRLLLKNVRPIATECFMAPT